MSEHWPSTDVDWHEPAYVPTNTARWQTAIDDALVDSTLRLESTANHDFAELVGACPRCGHRLQQALEFEVVRGIDEHLAAEVGRFNIDCTCPNPHDDRPPGRVGCGWGGPLPVTIRRVV
ncbi:MAG: hypothetical protein ABI112_03875 [Terracoccus sp.]